MPDLRLVAEYDCVVDRFGLFGVRAFLPGNECSLEGAIVGGFPNGARLKVTVEQLPDDPNPQSEPLRRTG